MKERGTLSVRMSKVMNLIKDMCFRIYLYHEDEYADADEAIENLTEEIDKVYTE